ncbi:nucleotidyltransferase [Bacillus kexueae]|uniref:nucleotidyltransferase n=1 Tax=Aeribacillus kexueae TaxID=2078952 RepID=UPI001FAF12F2|nr:nucleotidyltransferase [Bacillus kexueae]
MKATGLVVEYNPFHNGHYYHLQMAKEKTKADCIIAVMSGYFLQRGEPALVSKWARAKMALESGVDLIVELPYAFSTQSAEYFAKGSIAILDALRCQSVCFGSEQGDIEPFKRTLDLLTKKKEEYNVALKYALDKGHSYPKAKSIAFHTIIGPEDFVVDLSQPNNILGFQYLNAIHTLGSKMSAETIKRIGGGYHDETLHQSSISSATSIRKALFEHQDLSSLLESIPKPTYHHLNDYFESHQHFHRWESYFPLLKYAILTKTKSELANIYEVEEGLEHRLKSKIKSSESFHSFLHAVKTKRYTRTRLQRVCVHILTNTTKEQMDNLPNQAPYIRLLGMNRKGQQYLKKVKKSLDIPLVAKLSAVEHPLLDMDIKAANVYALALDSRKQEPFFIQEYATAPLRFDEERKTFLT